MYKKRMALALAVTLALMLCAASALAGETDDTPVSQSGEASSAQGGAFIPEVPSPAGPDTPTEAHPEIGEAIDTGYDPGPVGSITFENVEQQMRERNLSILALQESVNMLENFDYEGMQEDLRKQLNEIAEIQWFMISTGQSNTPAYQQMEQSYNALNEQFKAIRNGELQSDNNDALRQVTNLQDQIILSGEATYVALKAMEIQESSLQRQLESMNRTVEEMELRYQLGQISALQLSEAKAGQTSLASGLETLQMNLESYKIQLQLLLGAEMDGQLTLGPVPAVTQAELDAMDLEADLALAKERSYELLESARTLEDVQEAYEDSGYQYDYDVQKMPFLQAKHNLQAAKYNHDNTIQDYERRFRVLYAQVNDYYQIWQASLVSLENEKLSCAAQELKYQQGTISHNALLTAQDELADAEETVQRAANDLFSAYNTYCWAVQHGILN